MSKINYFVGIDPIDKQVFVDTFNELAKEKDIRLIGEYDDREGYYTYSIEGDWDSYQCFLNEKRIVKSIEHYEE